MTFPNPRFTNALCTALLAALALFGCATNDSGASGDRGAPPTSAATASSAVSISESIMRDVTKTLSQDAFEGRAPGSVGEDKTLALLTERFAAAGLTPGNNGSWFQEVPLVGITAENVSPLVISDGNSTQSFSYGSEMIVGSYREVANTAIENSDIVFVGYGINAPERDWNDYADVDVTGKTVLIMVNDPDFGSESLAGRFGGRAMTYYGRWTYKYEEAARQGAAAALIIHDTAPAGMSLNQAGSVHNFSRRVQTGALIRPRRTAGSKSLLPRKLSRSTVKI